MSLIWKKNHLLANDQMIFYNNFPFSEESNWNFLFFLSFLSKSPLKALIFFNLKHFEIIILDKKWFFENIQAPKVTKCVDPLYMQTLLLRCPGRPRSIFIEYIRSMCHSVLLPPTITSVRILKLGWLGKIFE